MSLKLPILKPDDYLTQSAEFWKEYRITLYKIIKEKEQEVQLEKTPRNIYEKAKEIGVKPTARYFNIQPSQVRYYIKKIEKELSSQD